MCKSWCQPFSLGAHHYFDFKGHGSWVEFLATTCFVFVCLFVCFSTPKVGDYFVFKSHKLVRFSCFICLCVCGVWVCVCVWGVWGCVCVCVCVFCVVFPSKCSISRAHHISRVRLIFFFFFFVSLVGKVFCFLLFLFVCFYLILFCFLFCFQNFHTPLISNGAPLFLFYYTDDGGHYVIDKFEFPCNPVKNLIPIWNFNNTFIQECKIMWEFQIRWGGTSLLRPLWRSWRYLKAYSLMSNRGRFQNLKVFFF